MPRGMKGNRDNLDPVTTNEEARKRGSAGGKKSGIARAKKRAMAETMEIILTMPLKDGMVDDIESVTSNAEIAKRNVTVQDAIIAAQAKKAMKGDTRAAEFIRDLIGAKVQVAETSPLDGIASVLSKFAEDDDGED